MKNKDKLSKILLNTAKVFRLSTYFGVWIPIKHISNVYGYSYTILYNPKRHKVKLRTRGLEAKWKSDYHNRALPMLHFWQRSLTMYDRDIVMQHIREIDEPQHQNTEPPNQESNEEREFKLCRRIVELNGELSRALDKEDYLKIPLLQSKIRVLKAKVEDLHKD